MKPPKIISYTPQMLYQDNLMRGAIKEGLLMQEFNQKNNPDLTNKEIKIKEDIGLLEPVNGLWLVEELPLSVRAIHALNAAGYKILSDCKQLSYDELCLLKNVGRKTADEIYLILTKNQLFLENDRKVYSDQNYLVKILSIPISEIVLSVRATNVLKHSKSIYLIDLVQKDPDKIIRIRNCGRKTLNEIDDFLRQLDLRFRMRFSLELFRNVHNYRESKSAQYILNDIKKNYPEKYRSLIKAKLNNVPEDKTNFYLESFRLYQEGGTLDYVGKKLNLTRERIRQILKKGTSLGLFKYSGREYHYLEKGEILKNYEQLLSVHKVAKANNVAVNYLKRILTAYKITERNLEKIKETINRNKCIKEYQQIVTHLGHHPTTTELQRNKEWNFLARRILKFWGTTDNFRNELNVPIEVRIFPERVREWIEKRKRLAFVVRMQNLDQIRDCLSSSLEPMSCMEIATTCYIKSPQVLRLLNLLIARKEIIREGEFSSTKYKIVREAYDHNI